MGIIKQHIGVYGKIYNEYEPSEAWLIDWQKGYDEYIAHVEKGGNPTGFNYPKNGFSGGYAEGVISARARHLYAIDHDKRRRK